MIEKQGRGPEEERENSAGSQFKSAGPRVYGVR